MDAPVDNTQVTYSFGHLWSTMVPIGGRVARKYPYNAALPNDLSLRCITTATTRRIVLRYRVLEQVEHDAVIENPVLRNLMDQLMWPVPVGWARVLEDATRDTVPDTSHEILAAAIRLINQHHEEIRYSTLRRASYRHVVSEHSHDF